MFKSLFPFFVLATFLLCGTHSGSAQITFATDIVFYPHSVNGPCDKSVGYASCYGVSYYHCCWAYGSNSCDSVSCDGCVEGDTINAYSYSVNVWPNLSGCNEGLVSSCINVDSNDCCVSLPPVDSCQVNFIPKFTAKKNLEGGNKLDRACTQVQPNAMAFVDEEGVKHEVHLPQGTYETAAAHFKVGNWTALKNFPAWENLPHQRYVNDGIEAEVFGRNGSLVESSVPGESKPLPDSSEEEFTKRDALPHDSYLPPLDDYPSQPTGVTGGDERFIDNVMDEESSKRNGRLIDKSTLLEPTSKPNWEDNLLQRDDCTDHPISVNDGECQKDDAADGKVTERDDQVVDASALLKPKHD